MAHRHTWMSGIPAKKKPLKKEEPAKMKSVVVKQDPDAPIPTEVLADAIVAISQGVKKLRGGRLSDRTLCLLIQEASPSFGQRPTMRVGIRDVKAVLDGIEALEATHLKKKPPKP